MGTPIHQNCPFKRGDLVGPQCNTWSWAHASRQPKWHLDQFSRVCTLHRWPWSVPILYNGLPVSPSKLPLLMLASGPHVICGSLGPSESWTQMAAWSFQLFLQGSLVWQTDRATDRPRYSVWCGIIMRNCVGYGKATHSFHLVRTISPPSERWKI